MPSKRYYAIDVGGTKVEAAIVDSHGKVIVGPSRSLADPRWSPSQFIECLAEILTPLRDPSIHGLGLGFPGLVDIRSGTILSRTVFQRMIGTRLREVLETRFSVPARVDTDANLFALGIHAFGQTGCSNLACLTLGTNLGVGIVNNGSIDRGAYGISRLAERLFETSDWWRLLSGARLQRLFDRSVIELAIAARSGEAPAKTCFSVIAYALAHAVQILCGEWPTLQTVVLGGGIAEASDLYIGSLAEQLRQLEIAVSVQTTKVESPALAGAAAIFIDDAGIDG